MQPGTVIADRFELDAVAGSGGMGTVWQARDRHAGGPVAVKILDRIRFSDTERFVREAAMLAQLSHPAIVRYVAHGQTPEGDHYLAMEWLEGHTLGDRLSTRPLSLRESVLAARRTAAALGQAHGSGVVHRDIKPANLFLPGGNIAELKVLDFGLARRMWESQVVTLSGALVGTPGYMAPEQARGQRDLDARADVFSLGCVLYECLTGRPAFVGEHLMAVLAKVLLEEPIPVRELSPDVPPELEALVMSMLAKPLDDRPMNCAVVAAQLEPLCATLDDSTCAPARSRAATAVPDSLSGTEQRIACLVLLAQPTRPVPSPAESTLAQLRSHGPLDSAVRAHGAQLELLADGSAVARVMGAGASTDQAVRAARCALALEAMVPHARIVLVTGRAVVSARFPIGEAIDRGVRALQVAGSGIRLDESTAGLLDGRFDIGRDEGGPHLRGERDVLEPPRTLLGKTTTCVGRDRELAVLQGIFEECIAEPVARVVLVTGPAGVGKSRLRYEFWRRLDAHRGGMLVFFGAGDELRAGSPFGLLAPAVRRAAGILEGEPAGVAHAKLRARLSLRLSGDTLARCCEFLAELVGVPADAPGDALRAARQDPLLMGDALRAAWLDWMDAESAAQPVLVVLEDLHWGDLPSLKFVEAALERLRERPLMVLALARPGVHEQFPRLFESHAPQEMRLPALTRKASEKLCRQVLGAEVEPQRLGRIVDRSEGNPFSLEELIRAVATSGGEALPETVLGMVEARLDAVGTEAKRMLRAGSIFGQTFWRGGVSALLGGAGRSSVGEWLDDLVAREVILPRSTCAFAGEREYVFRHALLREAAYAMLTENDRRLGHRLAGEWLVAAGETDALVLAEHFHRGGQPEKAQGWYHRGALQALEGNDLTAAVARADRGLECGATGESAGALRLVQAQAHYWRGEYARAEEQALEAIRALSAGTTPWFQAVAEAAAAMGQQGRYDGVEQWSSAAREAGVLPEAQGTQLACLARAAGYLIDGGRFAAAARLLAFVEQLAGGVERLDPLSAARLHGARAKGPPLDGDPSATLAECGAALAAFEQIGDLRGACEWRVNLGFAYAELGDLERAEQALREAFATAERLGLHSVAAGALHNLGAVLGRRGALAEARDSELRAAQFFGHQGDRRLEGLSRAYLAMIAFFGGELAEAQKQATAAVEILQGLPSVMPTALAWLARVLGALGRTAEALARAREAMDLLVSLGGVEESESLVRLVLPEALEAAGEPAAARVALRDALARLREREERIRDPSWRERFLRGHPDNARTLELAVAWQIAA